MTDQRYAPPTARVADTAQPDIAPPLWNPNAAANWSLLFTPAFGAYLQMRNWEALGDSQKAAGSRNWIYATVAVLIASSVAQLFTENIGIAAASRLTGLALLLGWYFSSGRAQASYVKVHFGKDYERKGWGKPLLVAFGVLVSFYFLVGLLVGVAVGMRGRV